MTEHTSGERGAQESGKVKWGSCQSLLGCPVPWSSTVALRPCIALLRSWAWAYMLPPTPAHSHLHTHVHACPRMQAHMHVPLASLIPAVGKKIHFYSEAGEAGGVVECCRGQGHEDTVLCCHHPTTAGSGHPGCPAAA